MHLSSVLQIVAYCENVSICRRKLLVEHFGEVFRWIKMLSLCYQILKCYNWNRHQNFQVYDAEACRTSNSPCDICVQQIKNAVFFVFQNVCSKMWHFSIIPHIQNAYKVYDVTEEAKLVAQSMLRMHNVTLKYLADLYRGHMGQKKFADMVGPDMQNSYLFLFDFSIS